MAVAKRQREPPTWRTAVAYVLLGMLAAGCGAVGHASHTLDILRRRHPAVLYSVDTDESLLAVTIDDGPDPVSTPRILDVLARNDAAATFFLIADRIAGNEALVRSIVAGGHELGNHLTRDEPSIDLAAEVFERELLRAHAILSHYGASRWFRPGSGWHDERMLRTLARHGYRCALGSVYPFDAQHPSTWLSERVILWRARPGAVIILHDAGARGARTAEVLGRVLPELRRRGYRVVTLSELVGSGAGIALSAFGAGAITDRGASRSGCSRGR